MSVALPGVFSGMDTETLIARLLAVNSRPLYQLDDRRVQWEARDAAVADIQGRLTTLKGLLENLRGADEIRSVFATSSDSTILTANAGDAATEGFHEVVVDRLAKSQKLVHTAGLAGLDETVGAEKATALNGNGVADADATTWFTTTVNGATYTFDFGDEADIDNVVLAAETGYSMNQAAALINARSQAVSGYDAASVEYDGQQGQYFLRLTAEESATAGVLTQTLTAGDAVDELNDDADWTKTAAGEGKLSYSYDGSTRTLYVTADTTLADLRDQINNDGGNPGVVASVLEHDDAYHLVLSGRSPGEDYEITIDDFETTLNGFDTSDFTETQAAQNARFRVDGYPAEPNWIERSANTITDVLPGVTLNLRAAGTANVTLNRNTADLKDTLRNLVAIYNGLVAKAEEYTDYDPVSGTRGILQGDQTINRALREIRSVLVSTAPGFLDGSEPYTLGAEIGLTLGSGSVSYDDAGEVSIDFGSLSRLSIDEAVLDQALADDYAGVLGLIGDLAVGATDDDYIQFSSAEESTEPGSYDVAVDFAADGSIQTARIKGTDEVAWRYMEIEGNTIYGEAGTDEQGVVLMAVSDGTPGEHMQTATLRVRQGLASAIYDKLDDLLDETSGAFTTKRDQIAEAIEDLEEAIEDQEERLLDQEERLREQFARLEGLLASYDRQRSAVEQLFNQVNAFANYVGNR